MLHVSHQACGPNVIVDIDIIFQYARCRDSQSGILIRRVGVIDCLDLVLHIRYSDGDGGRVAVNKAVICRKGKAVLAKIVKGRSVAGNVANQGHGAVCGLSNDRVFQRIAFNVHSGQGDINGGFFNCGHSLVFSNRNVVHCGCHNGNGGNVAVNSAVISFKGKAVLTKIVKGGSVSGNIVNQLHLAVSGFIDDRISKRVAIHIGGNHGNFKRGVLRSRHILVLGNRRVVHRGDSDCDGSDIAVG